MSEPVVIERDIHVPGTILFDLWTQAEHLGDWYCGGGTAVSEPRVGGVRELTGHDDAGNPWREHGTYLTVEAARQITCSLTGSEASVLTVSLEDTGGSTHVTLTHTGLKDAQQRDAAAQQWQARLTALINYLSAI